MPRYYHYYYGTGVIINIPSREVIANSTVVSVSLHFFSPISSISSFYGLGID